MTVVRVDQSSCSSQLSRSSSGLSRRHAALSPETQPILARWFSNLEYVFSYKKMPAFAHTLFVDVGNVYYDLEDVDFTDFHYTVGTGLRWKLESFVKTELFLDYGYNPETQEGKLYGGTSLNF